MKTIPKWVWFAAAAVVAYLFLRPKKAEAGIADTRGTVTIEAVPVTNLSRTIAVPLRSPKAYPLGIL